MIMKNFNKKLNDTLFIKTQVQFSDIFCIIHAVLKIKSHTITYLLISYNKSIHSSTTPY